MKICVFSDIHGNWPAFRVAHDMIISEKADLNIFLGDLWGYYFDHQKVYEGILSLPNLVALQGNHDQIFLKVAQGDENLRRDYLIKYGRSLEHFLEKDNHELCLWLSTLPGYCSFPNLGLVGYHGSPWSPSEGYVYPDTPLEKFLDYPDSLFILGHTHYPMERKINNKLIVNPGSLGQPRQGGWPTYATINYPSEKVIFKEVPYDKSELVKQIDKLDVNNQYLRKVLFR